MEIGVTKDLIDILPDIIMYIVTGYVFIKTFHFVALKQNSSEIQHILTSSLVVGYVYCNIASLIPLSISYIVDFFGIVISAAIAGYVLAILLRNEKVAKILDFLKIRNTFNLYYWDDLMDNDYPMKARITFEDVSYEGMLHVYESYSNDPHVAMASYVVINNEDKIIEDYKDDETRVIILDTSKAKKVEFIYDKESEICKDLKYLCNNNSDDEQKN